MKQVHENISDQHRGVKRCYRDRLDLLASRVNLLSGKDRLLMTMYLENGNSLRQMAALAGVSHGYIARRIYNITKRITDGPYIICLKNRDEFTPDEMDMAKDSFLLGLAIRKIAVKRNLTYYQVYKTLGKIKRRVKRLNSNNTSGTAGSSQL